REAQRSTGGTMASIEVHGILARMAQAFYGLVFYPIRTLLPFGLSNIYEFPRPFSPLATQFLVAAAGVLIITAILILLRRRFPAGLAAWACYVVIVAPVLGIAQSGPQLVADRYSYLSCLPLAILAAGISYAWSDRDNVRR